MGGEELGVRSEEHNCFAADSRHLPDKPCFPVATGKWPEGPIGDFYESFNCFAMYERPIPRIAVAPLRLRAGATSPRASFGCQRGAAADPQ